MSVGKIQTSPPGLLNLLGMVGSGQEPVMLADEVRGTFELLDFYAARYIDVLENTSAVARAAGNTVSLVAPPRETWILYAAQCSIGANAGDTARMSIRVRTGAIQCTVFSSYEQTATIASASLGGGVLFPRPLILRPGMEILSRLDDADAVGGVRTQRVAIVLARIPG